MCDVSLTGFVPAGSVSGCSGLSAVFTEIFRDGKPLHVIVALTHNWVGQSFSLHWYVSSAVRAALTKTQCQSRAAYINNFTMHLIYLGAGIAQWLEHRTRDWKVAGSNPCWNGGRIFFSRVDFLCWLLFRYPFHPRVTTVARKKSRSFCQKCRWQVTAKHAYTLRIEPCFGIGHNLSLICKMTSEDIKHQLIIIILYSSGAVWESRWTSWAVRPNEPSGFRGRKELLNRASALVTTCP